MKKKQLIGIIITGVVIIAVGITGILSNILADRFFNNGRKTFGSALEKFVEDELNGKVLLPENEFIGVINIVGEIGASSSRFVSSGTYNHRKKGI